MSRSEGAHGPRPGDPTRAADGAGGPLRRALAAICARLLEPRAYERLCFGRLRDYARERVGLSARQLQDLAHAHRAFATLPRLEQEVRAARGLSESALDAEAEVLRVHVSLHCTPAVREQWLLAREFAERVSGQRLREDEALECVTAEALSAVAIDADPIGEPVTVSRGPGVTAVPDEPPLDKCVRAPAPDAPAAAAASLDRWLRAAVQLEQTLDAEIAPLLRIVTCRHWEWDAAYWKLTDFAAERLGMSASKARALLRAETGRPVSESEAFSAMLAHALTTWT